MSYLLSATILLFALWPAYYVLLRYSERYTVNRILLLLAMVAACALPFVSFESPAPVVTTSVRATVAYVSSQATQELAIVPDEQTVFVNPNPQEVYRPELQTSAIAYLPTWALIYGSGVGLLFLVMMARLLFVFALHLRSRPNGDGSYRLLHPGAKPGQAFTFGRQMYFSLDVPDAPDFEHVLAHERVHARQGHSLDILLTELFLCVFWFHPAAWWLRAQTRANLEYLVDRAVLNAGSDRRSYQLALVRQSQAAHSLTLTLPFSEPSLKSRIARMTGMPEYRVVASLAAVALLFWLGVAVVVINGEVFADALPTASAGDEYLAAVTGPGDPFFDHYEEVLPKDLKTLEIYTDRMLTGNEYLQIRAIVSHFDNTALYLRRQPFDEGYTLELYRGKKEDQSASVYPLNTSTTNNMRLLSLERSAGGTDYLPGSAEYSADYEALVPFSENMAERARIMDRSGEHDVAFYEGHKLVNPSVDIRNMSNLIDSFEPRVFVNGQRIQLVDGSIVIVKGRRQAVETFVNGIDIDQVFVGDWPSVRVEGQPKASPLDRLQQKLNINALDFSGGKSYESQLSQDGVTFRAWYEKSGWPLKGYIDAYYNDRRVALPFLLDTEFGNNALLQVAVDYRESVGYFAVQVIDDDPTVGRKQEKGYFPGGLPFVLSPEEKRNAAEVDIYLTRMPTSKEATALDGLLSKEFGVERLDLFHLYRDCYDGPNEYSLHVGDLAGPIRGFSNYRGGVRFPRPKRIKLAYYGAGKVVPVVYGEANWPNHIREDDMDFAVNINGEGFSFAIDEGPDKDYSASAQKLGPPPSRASLRCIVADRTDQPAKVFKSWSYPTLQEGLVNLFATRDKANLEARPATFYINDEPSDMGEFTDYEPSSDDAYMQMGTFLDAVEGIVVFRIVDPG